MNQLVLSKDLNVLEFEISQYKQQAGASFWEIGRRLNYVKTNDLTHGKFTQWLKEMGIDHTAANRLMKIAIEIPNSATMQNLGISVLSLIASLPAEQREVEHATTTGEVKLPKDMSVKELSFLKQALKQEHHPVINNEDKSLALQIELDEMTQKLNQTQQAYQVSVAASRENEELKKHFEELRKEIETLSTKRLNMVEELSYLHNYTKFKEELNVLLTKISPLRFSDQLVIIKRNPVFINQYLSLVDLVQDWCMEMRSCLNKEEIIEGVFTD